MARTAELAAGSWWRFSRYELSDGYLRPARGARLEQYDPWAEYWQSRERRRPPPYQSLLDILRELRWTDSEEAEARGKPLVPEAESKLRAWCSAHGLLGILPHRVLVVTLAPRWEPLPKAARRGLDRHLRPVQREFVRASTEWVINRRNGISIAMRSKRHWLAMKDAPVRSDFEPTWGPPRVIIQSHSANALTEEPLKKTWAKFFPAVSGPPDEYPWPVPLSREFWRLYAEPFEQFLWEVIRFRDVLRYLTEEPRGRERNRRTEGRLRMHALLSPVNPVLEAAKGGEWKQRWVSMSLLGSFAMMALLDLTEGWRARECHVCKRTFVSEAWQATYCSARCRHTSQKRRYRKRAKKNKQRE